MEHSRWSVIPRGMERKQSWNRNNQYQARQVLEILHSNLFQGGARVERTIRMGDASSRLAIWLTPPSRAWEKTSSTVLDQEERFWGPIFFFLRLFFYGQRPPAHHIKPNEPKLTGTWRPPTFFPLAVVAAWHPFLPEQRCPIRGSSSQQPIRAKRGRPQISAPPSR